jgi:hypothetical protein
MLGLVMELGGGCLFLLAIPLALAFAIDAVRAQPKRRGTWIALALTVGQCALWLLLLFRPLLTRAFRAGGE